MGAKQITFDQEARQAVAKGVEALAEAVATTLGPRGQCVVIEKSFGSPTVTKDGVTVAKEIDLACRVENIGAQLVKEAASKTSDAAGDGTTTATVLAASIFTEGLRNIAAGADPMSLKRGIDRAVAAVVEDLAARASAVSGSEDIQAVAAIAANNDAEIGERLAFAMDRVGKDGVITVEEGKTRETIVEFVEGMQFNKGYLSPYFVTSEDTMECVLEDALVLIHEKKISSLQDIIPLLEVVVREERPLLIVSEDVESEALATLVVNRLRGILRVAAVKAPGFGDRRKAMLGDLAALTGATAITEDLGGDLKKATGEELGRVKRVVITKDTTTLIEGAGAKEAVQGRIRMIQGELEACTSDYDREKLQERLAKLSGGVAKIQVGGSTEVEVKERKARVEDALHATRAAVEEGIVPGGGVALVKARAALATIAATGDEATGVEIVRRALATPLRRIAANAGADPALVMQRVENAEGAAFGYNARTCVFEDLLAAGVIDPKKVTRAALQNAASVATMLLTTEALVVEATDDD